MSSAGDNADITAATRSISYNIILQVLIRIVSFVSNAVTLRFISKEVFGVINVRLVLLYSTTQCLSREAVRRSCIGKIEKKNMTQIFNLLWIPTCLSIVTGVLLRIIWLYLLENPDSSRIFDYSTGVNTVMYCVIVEIISEPLYVLGQNYNFITLKVIVEGLSIALRSLCMAILVAIFPERGIYCFCCSQVLSSVFYSASYYIYFSYYLPHENNTVVPLKSVLQILPNFSMQDTFHSETLLLTWSFYKQTILKQILTEGERYIMTVLNVLNFSEQGIYDIVNSLASLAARFVFYPIEESGYVLFTSLLKRGLPKEKQENHDLSLTVLKHFVKFMIIVSFTILSFGLTYSQLLLLLYGGTDLSNSIAVSLMKYQCLYIVFIAANGVTECFVLAHMSHLEVNVYNKLMIIFSLLFLILSYNLTVVFGPPGLIFANYVNMGCRITFSLYYIKKYFCMPLHSIIKSFQPNLSLLLTFIACYYITYISECYLFDPYKHFLLFIHICIGGFCFCVLLYIIYRTEKSLVLFIKDQWKGTKSNAKME